MVKVSENFMPNFIRKSRALGLGLTVVITAGWALSPAQGTTPATTEPLLTQTSADAVTSSLIKTPSPWFMGLRVGTTGVEGEVGYTFNDTFRIRGSAGGLTHFRRNLDVGSLKANNLDVRIQMAKIHLDWHFLKNGLRITGGLAFNGSRLKFDKDLSNIDIPTIPGFNTGPNAGFAHVEYRYRRLAPFIGVGYDSPGLWGTNISFTCDAGLMFMGNPKSKIKTTTVAAIPAAVVAGLTRKAETDANNLPKTHGWLRTYPAISLGLRYTF